MKKGWQTKRFGDVCAFDKVQGLHRGLPYVGLEHIESQTGCFIGSREPQPVKSSTFRFSEKHVLYGRLRPYLNKALGPDFEGHCSTEIFPIKPGSELSREYLLYWLLADETCDRINATCTGARMPRADMNELLGFEFPLPPLPEQQRIVGILDEAFEGIATAKANAEKNLQNARALFNVVLCHSVIGETTKAWRDAGHGEKATADSDLKSLLRQIATTDRKPVRSEETIGRKAITDLLPEEWRLASIEQLFNLIDYRGKTATKSGSGRRLITARNIRMGFLSEEPMTFISEEQYKKWMVRGFPKPGDIFFVTEGHTMGFVALNTRTDEFALAQRTITLQPPVPFITRFFFYFMLSSHFQKLVKLNATGAAAVGMKASKFRSLPLAFPSFTEQKIIADKLDALREETQRLESIYQQKLAALDELKKSLLHLAFTGAL